MMRSSFGSTPVVAVECAMTSSSAVPRYTTTTLASGRSILNPMSVDFNVLLFANSMSASSIFKSVVLTKVVSPRTSKFPLTIVVGASSVRWLSTDTTLGVVTLALYTPVSPRVRIAWTSPVCVTKTLSPTLTVYTGVCGAVFATPSPFAVNIVPNTCTLSSRDASGVSVNPVGPSSV